MKISAAKVASMTGDALVAEFKKLADVLQPINARRKLIADEIKKRKESSPIGQRLKFMTKKEKNILFLELQKDRGE